MKNNFFDIFVQAFVVIVFGAVILIFFVMVLGGDKTPVVEPVTTSKMIDVEYITIDGMPCLLYDGFEEGGITCDWSKWNGTLDGDTVIP